MKPDHDEDAAQIPVLPPAIYAVSVVAGIVVHWVWPFSFARGGLFLIAFWIAVIGAGVALVATAYSIFRRMGQDPNPRTSTPAITRDGPYRFTRNPMYVGLSLIQIGIALALGNGWILLFLVPAVILMHQRVILREEAYLEEKFGDEYREFKSSVRRWI